MDKKRSLASLLLVPGRALLTPRYGEKLLESQGKPNVATYFEFATEEGALRIELSLCHRNPVRATDRKGDIRLLYAARDKLTSSINDS